MFAVRIPPNELQMMYEGGGTYLIVRYQFQYLNGIKYEYSESPAHLESVSLRSQKVSLSFLKDFQIER